MKRTEFLKRLGTAAIMEPIFSSGNEDEVAAKLTITGLYRLSALKEQQ